MKILWVNPNFLHPTTKGGQIRTLEMLRCLHRDHEIHYVAFADPAHPEGPARAGEYSTASYPIAHQPPARGTAAFAAQAHANARATELLMDACVALGLLAKADGVYTNTEEAQTYLTRNSPQTLAGYALYSSNVLWQLWDRLPDAVREGSNRWPQAFNMQGPIFSHFFKTEEAMRTFLTGLHGFGMLSSPQAIAAHDLSEVQHFVDLGGGTGVVGAAAALACTCSSVSAEQGPAMTWTLRPPMAMSPTGMAESAGWASRETSRTSACSLLPNESFRFAFDAST